MWWCKGPLPDPALGGTGSSPGRGRPPTAQPSPNQESKETQSFFRTVFLFLRRLACMKNILSVLCLSITAFIASAQTSNPYFTDSTNQFTTAQQRKAHKQHLIDNVIKKGLQQPLSPQNTGAWQGAFWAMELLLYKDDFTQQKLSSAWGSAISLPEAFQKVLLEVTYTLYPQVFHQQVSSLLQQTKSVPVFVRCAEYLFRNKPNVAQKLFIRQQMHQKFNYEEHPALRILYRRLYPQYLPQPKLTSFFSSSFLPGKTIIYSLQRAHRNAPGLVIIRKGDGSFVKDSAGKLFSAAQLARAITAYPFYITNGNTPQGIFRWTGFGQSDNNYIGPTANLQMVMPFEATPAVYFGDSTLPQTWRKEMYASLLPSAFSKHPAFWEAYDAGEVGRSEIIMHGTAIDPEYYAGRTYFPQTPSLGCLCSYEEWDAAGRLKQSEQQKIIDALKGIGASEGYVVVLNLDHRPEPVTIAEVSALLKKK
jgi:hypothetical protein